MLGHALGLDKTTLTSLLDRLESDGLIVRSLNPHDRRARIPEITVAGRRVQARVTRARDHAEDELLESVQRGASSNCCATCSPGSLPASTVTACPRPDPACPQPVAAFSRGDQP